MSKNIVIKLVILLVVAALVYSVFWFFKVGQVEKQITNFISENNAYVSAGEIAVSGFPLSQKVTIKDLKFTIPNALLNKRQTVVKHLEAKAGIFSSDFIINLSEGVLVQDLEGNSSAVEFSKAPEISATIADGRIIKFNYQDSGYRILDAEKNITYAASGSLVKIESFVAADDKITTKITANARDIEGFDVINVYKNAFEKKVIEGIKTGEIALGSNSMAQPVVNEVPAIDSQVVNPVAAVVPTPVAPVADVVPAVAVPNPTPAPVVASDVNGQPQQAAPVVSDIVKSNLTFDLEYILVPNKTEQQAQVPSDPTQIQEVPVQYSKTVRVNNLEFSNPLYKIIINGEMSSHNDDNMPSGSLAIKIEKIDSLIGHFTTALNKTLEQKKPAAIPEVQAADLNAMPNPNVTEDPYQNFLKRVSANLSAVAKELAAKNAVSKEDIAEFDIRREKNLEFLVNETSTREILGKF